MPVSDPAPTPATAPPARSRLPVWLKALLWADVAVAVAWFVLVVFAAGGSSTETGAPDYSGLQTLLTLLLPLLLAWKFPVAVLATALVLTLAVIVATRRRRSTSDRRLTGWTYGTLAWNSFWVAMWVGSVLLWLYVRRYA